MCTQFPNAAWTMVDPSEEQFDCSRRQNDVRPIQFEKQTFPVIKNPPINPLNLIIQFCLAPDKKPAPSERRGKFKP
jgi:hypothetical protein